MKGFWSILEQKNYNKITVNDIVEYCDINRNTFYYHFQNIPELLTCILEDTANNILKKHGPYHTPMDCFEPIINWVLENKKQIMHIYRSLQKEVFINKLEHLSMTIAAEYIENLSRDFDIQNEDKSIIIQFYKCIVIGVTLDWLRSDLSYDLSLYLEEIFLIYKDAQHSALKNLKNSQS